MRAGFWVVVLLAGCSFDVVGTTVDDPGAGPALPSPTQSVPSALDAGTNTPLPPPTNPPPTTTPDMAQQRIGIPCTGDAQCDPGLFCAKSFGTGPGHVDIAGGYCTLACGSAACPPSSFCNDFGVLGKYCLSSCPPDPCRTGGGYVCCNEGGGKHGCSPTDLCSGKGGEN